MPRKQHEWDFIASTPNGELSFCRLCNQFRYDTGKPFKMADEQIEKFPPSYDPGGLRTTPYT